jgi:hypothetical protein
MNDQRLGANSSIPKMKNFWEETAEKERLEAVSVCEIMYFTLFSGKVYANAQITETL